MANYLKGITIKESKYGLKCSFKLDVFIEQLKSIANEKGYANVEIQPRKENGKYGETHYCKEDEWRPDPNYKKAEPTPASPSEPDIDDSPLPF